MDEKSTVEPFRLETYTELIETRREYHRKRLIQLALLEERVKTLGIKDYPSDYLDPYMF